MDQHIAFTTVPDGRKVDYAIAGSGPLLVCPPPWVSHLELDWESPVWRHWLRQFGDRHTVVRYDERGCGLSDTNIGDPSVDVWVGDDDGLVRKVQSSMEVPAGGETVKTVSTVNLTDWGTPVSVDAPPSDTVFAAN